MDDLLNDRHPALNCDAWKEDNILLNGRDSGERKDSGNCTPGVTSTRVDGISPPPVLGITGERRRLIGVASQGGRGNDGVTDVSGAPVSILARPTGLRQA